MRNVIDCLNMHVNSFWIGNFLFGLQPARSWLTDCGQLLHYSSF